MCTGFPRRGCVEAISTVTDTSPQSPQAIHFAEPLCPRLRYGSSDTERRIRGGYVKAAPPQTRPPVRLARLAHATPRS